jgi:hypothetical protein
MSCMELLQQPGMPIAIEYSGRNQYMINVNKPASNITDYESRGGDDTRRVSTRYKQS